MTLAAIEARSLRRGGRRPAVDRWSYARLAAAAAGVAGALRTARRAAVWAERSPEGAAALHGCALGGVCYVALDPAWPDARLKAVIEDCRPDVLVVGGRPPPGRAVLGGLRRVLVGGTAGRPVSSRAKPADAACILYTSGSTGGPKGVPLTQANVAAFLAWAARELPMSPSDRVLGVSAWTFDLSLFDLYATAAAGARLLVMPHPDVLFPAAVARRLRRARVTALYTVPSLLSAVLPLVGRGLPSLRLLLSAGEALPNGLARSWQRAAPQAQVWNLYGPTETGVCAAYRLPRPLPSATTSVPIGRPACGARLRRSAGGELLVSGPGVFPGYTGRRKADRFIQMGGRRYYKTGDLVRRDKGVWLFLGRRDDQVKWRGYRIELAEVEAALASHPAVARAGAALVETARGPLLRARVEPSRGEPAPADQVLRHAAGRLASYMVPERLDWGALPCGARGKLDRPALKRLLSDE